MLPISLLALLLSANGRPDRLAPREVVSVEVGRSRSVVIGRNVQRVAAGSPDLLAVAAFPPDQVMLSGKQPGVTTLTVWSGEDVLSWDVSVEYPREAILERLQAILKTARNLKLETAGAALVLSGEVADSGDVKRAGDIVRGYLGKNGQGADAAKSFVNLLRVAGDHQIQLEVSFAEVSRSALKQMGMNLYATRRGSALGLENPNGGVVPNANPAAGASVAAPLNGAFGILFALGGNDVPLTAAVSVLSTNGYARTLAEPTLVALSGQPASFLAGGEFPIAIPTPLGQIQVEWKKFGIQLEFVPTLVDETIQLKLATTVSDLDFSLGLKLASTSVPALSSRRSETVVRLRDGQNFAIAGLLSDKVRSNVDKVPALGDLPVIGALFRSTSYRRDETELLVVITARVVRPQSQRPALPGEWTRADPSDLELFLLGANESRKTAPVPKRIVPRDSLTEPVGPIGFHRALPPASAPAPAAAAPTSKGANP